MIKRKLNDFEDFFEKINKNKTIQEVILALSFLILSAYIGISYKHLINGDDFWVYKIILILALLTLIVLITNIIFMGKNRKVKTIQRVNRKVSLFTNFYRILLSLTNIMVIVTSNQNITIFEIIIILVSVLMLLYSFIRYSIFIVVYLYKKNRST